MGGNIVCDDLWVIGSASAKAGYCKEAVQLSGIPCGLSDPGPAELREELK